MENILDVKARPKKCPKCGGEICALRLYDRRLGTES